MRHRYRVPRIERYAAPKGRQVGYPLDTDFWNWHEFLGRAVAQCIAALIFKPCLESKIRENRSCVMRLLNVRHELKTLDNSKNAVMRNVMTS